MKIFEIELGTKLFVIPESLAEIAPGIELVTVLESTADDGHIVIYAPIHKNRIYPLNVGENLSIYFVDKGKRGRVEFQCVVEGRFKSDGLDYIKAQIISNIVIMQRRNYFRVETSLPGIVTIEKQEDGKTQIQNCKCVCTDISGGGAALRLKNTDVKVGDSILLTLPIGHNNQQEHFHAIIRWRGVSSNNERLHIGVQFYFPDNRQQDAVMKYVSTRQQEIIRRRWFR